MGRRPEVVIGDLDSLSSQTQSRLKESGTKFKVAPTAKDETDTELAIAYAADQGATSITVLGGIEGDRLDHVLANVLLLAHTSVPMTLASGGTSAWLADGPTEVDVPGAIGDTLSLIPLAPRVAGVTTSGLHYALADATLQMGKTLGISNVLTDPVAHVAFTHGRLLFVHTRPILT
jgi:thiamine pyrophosphokinase